MNHAMVESYYVPGWGIFFKNSTISIARLKTAWGFYNCQLEWQVIFRLQTKN